MNSTSLPVLRLAAGLVLAAQAALAGAQSLGDRLERPSRMNSLAVQAPLTDVQSVGNELVMVGASGHVLRGSANAVDQANVPVDLLLTAVHFVDDRHGWAVGHDGAILQSSDAGRNWTLQLDGRAIGRMMVDWAEAEVARLEAAVAAAPDDEALATALDNASFALDDARAGAEAGPARPLLDVWFRNADEGWAVGAYGMIVHTRDGGRTWEFLTGLDNPERLHLNAVLGLADGSLIVAGEGGRLHRLVEGQWQPVQQLTDASLYKLLALADGQLLVMGFGGALFESADQGGNWQAVATPAKASLYGGTQLADGSLVLTGQGGAVLHGANVHQLRASTAGGKTAWLAAVALPDAQLALVGSAGLRVLPLTELKEQLK